MPAPFIFDFSFLDYLNESHNLTSGSTEQNTSHYLPPTISTTFGIEKFLTIPFSKDDNYFSYNSSLSDKIPFGSTASYYSSVESAFLSEASTSLVNNAGDHDNTPLLKIASIPENFQKLSTNSRNCVIAYVILFCIGAPGNLFVFISVGREIWKRQLWRSRIKVLIWHLATADLFVTFVVIPIEVFWRLTIQWHGGDPLCKIAQFFRAFGLYLSSTVMICISLDRFFAIVFPLKVIGGMKRVRNMLCVAWGTSILFAAPQVLVFRVLSHPLYPSFLLCSNSDYFLSLSNEIMYNLLSLVVMYFAPLLVIIVTYAMVLYTIARKSREQLAECRERTGSNQMRRSDNASNITRARRKTLKLSMVIVTVFVLCWTPYVGMTLWYMFDFESADKLVDPQIHEAFFVTAVSNSCVNPIIYGNYMKKCWKKIRNGVSCQSRNSAISCSCVGSSRNNNQNQQRTTSTYRCSHWSRRHSHSRRCHSSQNESNATLVLREFSPFRSSRGVVTTTATATAVTSVGMDSRANWYV